MRALLLVCASATAAVAQPSQPEATSPESADAAPQPTSAPAPAPPAPPVTPAPSPPPPAMNHHLNLSVGFGFRDYQTNKSDDNVEVVNAVLDLSLRARIIPQLELGVAVSGGLSVPATSAGLFADVRWRNRPDREWNYFIGGMFGVVSIARRDSPTADEKAARPALFVVLGVEWRSPRWSIWADVKGGGVVGNSAAPTPTDKAGEFSYYSLKAGGLMLGVTTYFL